MWRWSPGSLPLGECCYESKLNDEHKKTLVTRMKAAYPTAGNEFLIALGADAVAAELAQSHSKGPK